MNGLLFIRHPETDLAGTFCGRMDPPVNLAGQRQLTILIESLRDEPITTVFTSDLQRALTAAHAIADFFNLPCMRRPDLREIGFGDWEGLAWDEIETLDATFAMRWLDEFPGLTPPRGEAFSAFEARVLAETGHLIEQSESGLIAVVTHAGVMRVVLQNLCGVNAAEAAAITKQYCCAFRYAHHAHSDRRLQELPL